MVYGLGAGEGCYLDRLWVSRVHNRYDIDQKSPAQVFRFEHPGPLARRLFRRGRRSLHRTFTGKNEKYGRRRLRFRSEIGCELVGFAGFLDAVSDRAENINC